jgi:hypothetical protein
MTTDKKYYGMPDDDKKKKKRESHDYHKLVVNMTTENGNYGKLTCMTCGNKFVKWLKTKEEFYMYK